MIGDIKIVCSGAGAAAIARLEMLVLLRARRQNIFVCDRQGVLTTGRALTGEKLQWAQDTVHTRLSDVIELADFYPGVSGRGLLTQENLRNMARPPIVFALANPKPQLRPELIVAAAASDAIVATGRSNYPNQVNNALSFPYLFRAALDSGATLINQEVKRACAIALADLAGGDARFGDGYIMPDLLDPGLLASVAPQVASAAFRSGVAKEALESAAYAARFDALAKSLG